jgi:putative membrane protein
MGMSQGSHAAFGTPFARNRFLQILLVAYAALWTLAAVEPVDRQTWLLENLLVMGAIVLLALTHRAFVFSRLSYGLICVFLLLHVVGAHYTYSATPVGSWVSDLLSLERNPYDRFVHFCFGLLLAYPAREWVLRTMHVHRRWSYVVPVLVIVTLSSVYEMIESWAARTVNPDVGMAFVGAQGDVWDGQKDMTLAMGGAVLAMALTALYRRSAIHEPYVAYK